MIDPLSEVITLLRPRTVYSKLISGAGAWAVRYSAFEQPSFCTVLEGSCELSVDGEETVTLEAGDFVLMPSTPGFSMNGFEPATPVMMDPKLMNSPADEVRHGRRGGKPDVRMLGGYFQFDSPDTTLLASLLPVLLHIRGAERLATLVQLVREESLRHLPGRDHVLVRLVEILMIESLRSMSDTEAPTGLLRGLADSKLAAIIRLMHRDPSRQWTVDELARRVALSRSAFYERFTGAVGIAPIEYLLAWRMAIAKDLLRGGETAIATIAERVGYGSASAFSTAFSRHVGQPPGRYARLQ